MQFYVVPGVQGQRCLGWTLDMGAFPLPTLSGAAKWWGPGDITEPGGIS